MNMHLYLLSMVVSTVAIELCFLRCLHPRRNLKFCVIVGGVFSGILWSAFSWVSFAMKISPEASRAVDAISPVGSGYSWEVLLFIISSFILCGTTTILAGLAAIIYRELKKPKSKN
jgi:uncharacterized BrkB/YihY/UPF0761 family membrane protein